MILNVFVETWIFIVLLFILILIHSCLELLTKKVSFDGKSEFEGTWSELFIVLDGQYNVGYGNWEGSHEYPVLLYILYLYSGVFTGLVLFNILIAIVSGTYEDFNNK